MAGRPTPRTRHRRRRTRAARRHRRGGGGAAGASPRPMGRPPRPGRRRHPRRAGRSGGRRLRHPVQGQLRAAHARRVHPPRRRGGPAARSLGAGSTPVASDRAVEQVMRGDPQVLDDLGTAIPPADLVDQAAALRPLGSPDQPPGTRGDVAHDRGQPPPPRQREPARSPSCRCCSSTAPTRALEIRSSTPPRSSGPSSCTSAWWSPSSTSTRRTAATDPRRVRRG